MGRTPAITDGDLGHLHALARLLRDNDRGSAGIAALYDEMAEQIPELIARELSDGSLRLVIHFADEPDLRAVDLRFEPLFEIAPFAARQLGRDAKLHPGGARDADCAFRSFLGSEAPQEGKIGPLFVRRAE